MTVLIAEHNAHHATAFKEALEPMGMTLRVFYTGAEAWRYLLKVPARILILNADLPDTDVLDLCRRLRSNREIGRVYVIIVLSDPQRADLQEWIAAEVDDIFFASAGLKGLLARVAIGDARLEAEEKREAESRERRAEIDLLRDEIVYQKQQFEDMMDNLSAANQRFAELFQGLPVACYSYDEKGRICEWNRVAVEMTGYQPHEAFSKPIWTIMRAKNPEEQKRNAARFKQQIKRILAGESVLGEESEILRRDGKKIHILSNTFPVFAPNGAVIGAISADIDISERKTLEKRLNEQLDIANVLNSEMDRQRRELERMNARLEALAITDGLTGLNNHRAFQDQLEIEFQAACRYNRPLSLVLLDVDNFKMFNDSFGHLAGDQVLKQVSSILQTSVRASDFVARYGGEEFVVILPDTGGEGSIALADRFRKAIQDAVWPDRPVTASVGIATLTPATPDRVHLIADADAALYTSKQQGRNRVTHFNALAGVASRSLPK